MYNNYYFFPPICGANINILLLQQALILDTSLKGVFRLQLCFTKSLTVSHISFFFFKRHILYGVFEYFRQAVSKTESLIKNPHTYTLCTGLQEPTTCFLIPSVGHGHSSHRIRPLRHQRHSTTWLCSCF